MHAFKTYIDFSNKETMRWFGQQPYAKKWSGSSPSVLENSQESGKDISIYEFKINVLLKLFYQTPQDLVIKNFLKFFSKQFSSIYTRVKGPKIFV